MLKLDLRRALKVMWIVLALAERDPHARTLTLPPTGRVARPDDIARLAVFFASDQSDHITGQAWTVDGGGVMH